MDASSQLSRSVAARIRRIAGKNPGAGTIALFAGPSGTGKTAAAEALATQLGRPIQRVDLSQVESPFIGETEKNLRQLFDAAEQSGALLFFDEADALFGKRSEVKDSHDRFANIEVNYLLQLIRTHPGVTVIGTGAKDEVDPALIRASRFVVDFPPPPT